MAGAVRRGAVRARRRPRTTDRRGRVGTSGLTQSQLQPAVSDVRAGPGTFHSASRKCGCPRPARLCLPPEGAADSGHKPRSGRPCYIAMRPEDLLESTRKRPFVPYRVCLTDGRTYDVGHPDQVIVLRSRAVIGVGGENGLPERVEHVALIHIVRIEELQLGAIP